MIFARCCTRRKQTATRRLAIGVLLTIGVALPALCAQWDREGARRAWGEAVLQREALESAEAPSRESYLKCFRAFQQVYFRDPHFSNSDDAIYEAAKIYQEMGDLSGKPGDYRNAVKLYAFLVRDYDRSPRCPEALLRLGMINRQHLDDPEGAKSAFEKLRQRYGSSDAAATLASMNRAAQAASNPTSPPPPPAAPQNGTQTPSAGKAASSGPATIRDVRYWSNKDHTRISIVSDGRLNFTKEHLANPERVFFDINASRVEGSLRNKILSVGDKFIRQIRIGQNRPDVVRVVLDLNSTPDLRVSELAEPFGITLEVRAGAVPGNSLPPSSSQPATITNATKLNPNPETPPAGISKIPGAENKLQPAARDAVTSAEPAASTATMRKKAQANEPSQFTMDPGDRIPAPTEMREVPAPPVDTSPSNPNPIVVMPKAALPTSKGDRTMIRMLGLKIGRIVLDPGHGGHDTGTVGPGGLMEKDLVLQLAKELKTLLQDRLGAEVIMTRDRDTYVSLEERTAIANENEADLFLSIHANSSSSRNTSGVETYYLDFARNEAARDVAARENASSSRNVRDLEDLVQQIARADKMAESRELASIVQSCLFSGARKMIPMSRNRGVRSAPFVVLIGAKMPSVLAEVAFISNPRDEKLLKRDISRQSLATALFQGIEGYMKTLGIEVAQAASLSAK
jgi:N-acetylmuramoyl-L-alanine amidase